MLRPSPNHRTLWLHNDDDGELINIIPQWTRVTTLAVTLRDRRSTLTFTQAVHIGVPFLVLPTHEWFTSSLLVASTAVVVTGLLNVAGTVAVNFSILHVFWTGLHCAMTYHLSNTNN